VWLKACEIAGQGFEGDPLDYLRAALRNKREREKAGTPAGSRSRGPSGLGVFYWEPTWTAVPGNGWDPADPASGNEWENQALFNFDHRPTVALNEFKTP